MIVKLNHISIFKKVVVNEMIESGDIDNNVLV